MKKINHLSRWWWFWAKNIEQRCKKKKIDQKCLIKRWIFSCTCCQSNRETKSYVTILNSFLLSITFYIICKKAWNKNWFAYYHQTKAIYWTNTVADITLCLFYLVLTTIHTHFLEMEIKQTKNVYFIIMKCTAIASLKQFSDLY